MRNPFLGASTGNYVVAAQIPWMRYREPQAIELRNNMLSLQFISQELVLGEGKGIWNFAKISFIPKGQLSPAALVQELARDNLRAGVIAEGDRPPVGSLSQPQQFMQTSMMYPFFYRYYRNYGDIDGHLRRALTQGPLILYRDGMDKQPDGRSILVTGGWASRPECTLSASGTEIVGFTRGLDSDGLRDMYDFNKPQTLALLLIAHSLDPSVNLCSAAKQAYDHPAMADYLNSTISNEAGWWKGADQAMQSLIFGVGLYDTCR